MRIALAILTTVISIIGLGGIVYFLVRWLQRTEEDRSWLVWKWVITVLIWVFLFSFFMPAIYGGGGAKLIGLFISSDPYAMAVFGAVALAVCGLAMALMWAPTFVNFVARPFTNLFIGGDTPPDPTPVYSKAMAHRNRGRYQEALEEVRLELEKFPNDAVGQMMAAEILATNLNDVEGAQATAMRLVRQPGHSKEAIALALNQVADWHLKYRQDVDGARTMLEEIIRLYPDTTEAGMAEQRIAHLGTGERYVEAHARPVIKMRAGPRDLGLQSSSAAPAEQNNEAVALVKRLREFPLDSEARERLAVVYAEVYQRRDLAIEQLEELVVRPNQPARQVVRWLNLMADLHIRFGADLEAAKAALQRIVELYPNQAAAEMAARRISHLPLEMKKTEAQANVALREYEQNLGLKEGNPRTQGSRPS